MRRLLAVTAALALLSFAACGGDDEEDSPTTGATGATGATGEQGASAGTDLTADEYIAASIPDQVEAVQDAVAADPECEGVDAEAGGDFQVDVAINAASAEPDTPLSEVVADQCAEE
jgi:hypothetical protein